MHFKNLKYYLLIIYNIYNKMVNQWIMFLRQYSKNNNISYSCAITEAAPSYRKMKEEIKTRKKNQKYFLK